jgi:hypothetical protein
MRRLRNTCLVILLLASWSFQFDRFIAAQSPQTSQQRQEQSGAKAQAAEQKQPDYSQEAYVIERMTTSYRFEKHVMASWALGQHSEVGDRLGQMSEKRGKKEEAVRWYALAAVGYRPMPEARENLTRLAGKDKFAAGRSPANPTMASARSSSCPRKKSLPWTKQIHRHMSGRL